MFDEKQWKYLALFGSGVLLLSISGKQVAQPTQNNPVEIVQATGIEEYDELPPLEPEPNPTLFFAGEPVPLHKPRVAAKLKKELSASQTWCSETSPTLGIIRHNLPKIERIIRKHDLPEDFKYVAVAESFFRHDVSPRGAAGVWQLMPETALEYGLIINDEIDERYNLEKATDAACRYIKNAHRQFGNWTITAAAYNRGIGGISREVQSQKKKSYYELKLNRETSRYIFKVLAVKELLENPSKYGMTIRKARLIKPAPVRYITIKDNIEDLSAFAGWYGLTYEELRELNPWIKANTLTVTEELPQYKIYIPRKAKGGEVKMEVVKNEAGEKELKKAA